jgi:RND family efflux transporter MFP subunit
MKNRLIAAIILLIVLSTLGFAGCRGKPSETSQRQTAEVERGDLLVSVPADGNLDMPREAQLKFGTPGTVKEIFVVEGQKVKEGTLLAKLDDSTQKLAVASAQYDVELAINNLTEKVCPPFLGIGSSYISNSGLLRFEQAQTEVKQALEHLAQNKYQDTVYSVSIAKYDIENTIDMLAMAESSTVKSNELDEQVTSDPKISNVIKHLEQNIQHLTTIQEQISQGNYDLAASSLNSVLLELEETHHVVRQFSRLPTIFKYLDASTSLAVSIEALDTLSKLQQIASQEDYDAVEFAETLRTAQHDLEMSNKILEENELIFRHGLNMKNLRDYNINLQKAKIALKKSKEELMKTEILAPFDGTVVDIGVKENDQLSSFDYSSKTAVYLVDTHTVKMEGVVDEVDIFKVKVGHDAIVTMDAMPGVELKGKVTFVSPFGSQTTGVVEFPVTISLEPTEMELKGGLTATADIIIEAHKNVLIIPNRAIKGSPGNYYVEVVIDEKTMATEKRQVELGAQNDNSTELVSGLSEGEKVIVEASRSRLPTSF